METITTVTIDESYLFTREQEIVSFGIPFAPGAVADAARIRVIDATGESLPLQVTVLGDWPDRSIRWAHLSVQSRLDFRDAIEWQVVSAEDTELQRAIVVGPARVTVSETVAAIRSETISCTISMGRELRIGIRGTDGAELVKAKGIDFWASVDGRDPIRFVPRSTRLLDSGPVRSGLLVDGGFHDEDDSIVLDGSLELRMKAGQRTVEIEASVQSRDQVVRLDGAGIRLTPARPRSKPARGYSRMPRAQVSETEIVYTMETDRHHSPLWYESDADPSWIAQQIDGGSVVAMLRHANHYYPTRISATDGRLEIDLQPRGHGGFSMYPWMSISGEIAILFSQDPEPTGFDLTVNSMLFQHPIRPRLSPEYYNKTTTLGEIFPTSRKYGHFEGLLTAALQQRTVGSGKMHFGDDPNLDYTYDQRGHGELVWTNGEYDTAKMLLLQYARTGNRAWFNAAEAAVRHTMDIDFLRNSPNPQWAGGVCCHEGDHRVQAYAGPSHEWLEGLLYYHFLTGNTRAREIAESIADNICRYFESGHFDNVGHYQMRELGWALVALSAMYLLDRNDRYLAVGRKIVSLLADWVDKFGGFKEVSWVSQPGQEEAVPVEARRDAFISLTLNGLAHFVAATGDEDAKQLFLVEVKAQRVWLDSIDGWAEQRETRIPNLESFAWAFRMTGDREYLESGRQILRFVLNNAFLRYYNVRRFVEDNSHSKSAIYRKQEIIAIHNQTLGLSVIPMLPFLTVAEEEGCLDWME